jgi:hypothetical protein
VRADVVDLSKRFSLVTAYTSFVVVADESYAVEDESGSCEDGELPQGGTYEALLLALGLLLCGAGGCIFRAVVSTRGAAA